MKYKLLWILLIVSITGFGQQFTCWPVVRNDSMFLRFTNGVSTVDMWLVMKGFVTTRGSGTATISLCVISNHKRQFN